MGNPWLGTEQREISGCYVQRQPKLEVHWWIDIQGLSTNKHIKLAF